MNRLTNIIGIVALCGILLKLCYVFVFLFGELDTNSFISRITGVTFAFVSIYFVMKSPAMWLKIVMIMLDVAAILFFYLHQEWNIPIVYSSFIIAAYSALVIFHLPRIVNESINSGNESLADRCRELEARLRAKDEIAKLETDVKRMRRRVKDSRTDSTRKDNEHALAEMEQRYNELIKTAA